MEHFYQNIGEDWFTYAPFYKKIVEVFDSGSHFVEIGSWKGRSSVYMAVEIINSKKLIKFDCVDTWKGSVEHVNDPFIIEDKLFDEFIKNIEPVKNIINPIRLSSKDASKTYDDEPLNFIFIDASHEYEDVKDDIIHWLPKLKKGGIMAGHDIAAENVNKAVYEILPEAKVIPFYDVWYIEKEDA
jgi:predicted O-methyltransferase YrrM